MNNQRFIDQIIQLNGVPHNIWYLIIDQNYYDHINPVHLWKLNQNSLSSARLIKGLQKLCPLYT